MNLKNVSLENATFQTKKGITVIDADGITLKNVKVIASNDYALTVYNSKNVSVSGFSFSESQSSVKVLGDKSAHIEFDKNDFSDSKTQLKQGKDVSKKAVKLK